MIVITAVIFTWCSLFEGVVEQQAAVGFMLKQLLCVLIECVAQSNEALSRLGCACIRSDKNLFPFLRKTVEIIHNLGLNIFTQK